MNRCQSCGHSLPDERDCAWCRRTFQPTRRDARFCSANCRKRANRELQAKLKRALECYGCALHLSNPRNTVRSWCWDDDSMRGSGQWMHADPSGVAYECTARDRLRPGR